MIVNLKIKVTTANDFVMSKFEEIKPTFYSRYSQIETSCKIGYTKAEKIAKLVTSAVVFAFEEIKDYQKYIKIVQAFFHRLSDAYTPVYKEKVEKARVYRDHTVNFTRHIFFQVRMVWRKIYNLRPKYFMRTMNLLNHTRTVVEELKKPFVGRATFLQLGTKFQKGVELAALGVAIFATWLFEAIMMRPINIFYHKKSDLQVLEDVKNLKNIDVLRAYSRNIIEKDQLFKDKSEAKIEHYIDRALATYGASFEQYAPIVTEWAHSLLETAKTYDPPQRLVFMARDGIAPYKIAKILKEKFPEQYGNVPLSLVYLSRPVVHWAESNEEMLRDYLIQRGIEENQACIFVDIGFSGSMIEPIKRVLKGVTTNIRFAFLVSLTQAANGFMSNMETKLDSVPHSILNPAVHWLEDTHQGVLDSPTHLVIEGDRVRPNTKTQGKLTCKDRHPKSYLYKSLGYKAIIDYAKQSTSASAYLESGANPQPYRMAEEKAKTAFDSFLSKYRSGERVSYARHL